MKGIARFLLFILLIVIVLSGFLFTARNTLEVPLWLGVTFDARPLGLWLVLAFCAGGLLGLLLGLGLWRRMRVRLELGQLRHKLQQSERELAVLKQQLKTSQN